MPAPEPNVRSEKREQADHPARPAAGQQDDDIVGKAYDSRLMARLIRYLFPYKWAAIISIVAIVLKAAADVLGPYLTMVAVDLYLTPAVQKTPAATAAAAARGVQGHPWVARWLTPFANGGAWKGITELTLIWLGALIFSYVLEALQTWLMQWTGQKVMFDLRSQIFRHLQRMHIAFFDRNPVGRLVTRLTTDVDALNEMFTSGVFAIFEDVFVLAGIVFVMIRMEWWLALVAFSVLPLILVATRIFRKYVRDSYRRIRVAIARINAFTQEYVTGMSLVQLFNREDAGISRLLRREPGAPRGLQRQHHGLCALLPGGRVPQLAGHCAHHLGGRRRRPAQRRAAGHAGRLYPVRAAILPAHPGPLGEVQHPAGGHGGQRAGLQAAGYAAGDRFAGDSRSRATGRAGSSSATCGSPTSAWTRKPWRGIAAASRAELEAMGEIEWVMRGVSFTIETHQTAAIVGHTGAGKTTITSLMMRFYDVQHGAGPDRWRRCAGAGSDRAAAALRRRPAGSLPVQRNRAGQHPAGYRGIADEDMHLAAEQVNVDDFIRSLPGGYEEKLRERGAGLSTGQKQLINFARALAHKPGILILDEATSSVDTDTEFRVRAALERMVEGRTSVVIAHRLSTVQRADVILVMHRGQLREMGSHQELLALHGIYWKLYQLQYKDQEAGRARQRIDAFAGDGNGLALATPKIFLSAGEASGEHYGTLLIASLAATVSGGGVLRPGRPADGSPRLSPCRARRRRGRHGHHRGGAPPARASIASTAGCAVQSSSRSPPSPS